MSLPLFPSGSDPGPSFVELVRRTAPGSAKAPAAALADIATAAGRPLGASHRRRCPGSRMARPSWRSATTTVSS